MVVAPARPGLTGFSCRTEYDSVAGGHDEPGVGAGGHGALAGVRKIANHPQGRPGGFLAADGAQRGDGGGGEDGHDHHDGDKFDEREAAPRGER